MLKTFLRKMLGASLAILLGVSGVFASGTILPASANEGARGVILNGTVDSSQSGYLNTKSVIMSSGNETKVNYRLVPQYAGTDAATDVIVEIFLPSLIFDEATQEYTIASREQAATGLGVQGRVSAGAGWNVLSDTTMKGGSIIMQYDGDLAAGVNPAFDLFVTTYNDGTSGPYGSVPEGTAFELNGYVKYEMFNRQPGTQWQSNDQKLDDESRVNAISSDLTWEGDIDTTVEAGAGQVFPIWDRYQYADYNYTLKNTSTNLASMIDGYTVTFDIDSTDSSVNGIIPFDINRWSYNPDGDPIYNDNKDYTGGQFVGVPGEGGVLIYDITNWDGNPENLGESIPYTYSGAGMIVIDRAYGANKESLAPEATGNPHESQYLVSLPLSRQGFPNPPTMFKVRAITNVIFAKTANWSKTDVVEREIAAPTYKFDYTHTRQQADVVYSYETFTEVKNIANQSNVPVFAPTIKYTLDPDFQADRVVFEVPTEELERYEDAEISYTYTPKPTRPSDPIPSQISETPESTVEHNAETGMSYLTFDISHLQDAHEWDRVMNFTTVDSMKRDEVLPISIKVYGEPYRIGEMPAQAELTYIEKFASNTDWSAPTTYTEVPHVVAKDTSFNVIYPKEVIPSITFSVNGGNTSGTVNYGERVNIDTLFGVNDNTANNSTTTIQVNKTRDALEDVILTIKPELFEAAENVRIKYTLLEGGEGVIDLTDKALTQPIVVELPAGVKDIIVDTDELTTDVRKNFISFTAVAKDGLNKAHLVDGSMRTYQVKPYDKDVTRTGQATVNIILPAELIPTVNSIGVYGSLRTPERTNVSYESTFTMDFYAGTANVNSPEAEYRIEYIAPSSTGALKFNKINVLESMSAIDDYEVVVISSDGAEQSFDTTEIAFEDITLDDIKTIVIKGENLKLAPNTQVATIEMDADIVLGSNQTLKATLNAEQSLPYEGIKTATKNNIVTVADTRTTLDVEGVNQVMKPLGVGNSYDVDIYRHWNPGGYYSKHDYTLDQGYKSLGGFTSTVIRPTATYHNNNQKTSVDVKLPYSHFDTYYVKINSKVKDNLVSVDLYRMVDSEEVLWKTVPASEWVENTQEEGGFWRINTAHASNEGEELFETYDNVADATGKHPYYKEAWDADVRPEAPISKVTLNMEFTRESNDHAPQMSGTNHDLVEYMGRFHSSSIDGKQRTDISSKDVIGTRVPVERTASDTINSLVNYPYAQGRTGAHDTTSTPNKIITMGYVGEYLGSVWNITDASWCCYGGHGADIYSPANTEYDEWLGMYDPASFHDKLIYQFVYPNSPKDDAIYNIDPQYFIVENTSTLKYMTGVKIWDEAGDTVEIALDRVLTEDARFNYITGEERGITDNGDNTFSIVLGEGNYPAKFEVLFEEVAGFGENTAELDGVNPDSLGANLNEVDIRVGGIVNGNQAQRGITNIYREPADTNQLTLMHTSSATLTGYTPKVGAQLNMGFDKTKVYDYGVDGITPNTSRIHVGVQNVSEADIKTPTITFTPDGHFRAQLVEIPASIFKDADWSVDSVTLAQGGRNMTVDLSRFEFNETTGNYELDLVELFEDGTLTTSINRQNVSGEAELEVRKVDSISVTFKPANDTVRLWGSLAQAETVDLLPKTLTNNLQDMFVTGVWVEEEESGSSWLSKPTFMNENEQASNEALSEYTSFNVSANVVPYQPIWTSASGTNNGNRPSYTRDYSNSILLYNRVATLETRGIHLNEDHSAMTTNNPMWDDQTQNHMAYNNIVVEDTAKALYEIRNVGQLAAGDDLPGEIPAFQPVANITVPTGMKFVSVKAVQAELLADANIAEIIAANPSSYNEITADNVKITEVTAKRYDIEFDTTLEFGQAVYFYVEFEAVNDYSESLFDTQGKSITWNVYTRPALTHHYQSYDSTGIDSRLVTGTTGSFNMNGNSVTEDTSRLYSTYTYSNPNDLVIKSNFDEENVSGKTMTLNVENIHNETLHDETQMELFITLDRREFDGFELTEFPTPTYPAEYTGEFAAPLLYFKDAADAWVLASDFDSAIHEMKEIDELKVDYGIVPALHNGEMFAAPNFNIEGIGHWKSEGNPASKSYTIYSRAQILLSHNNDEGEHVAQYQYTTEANRTAWKAIPTVELNLQSFATLAEAEATYNGAALGKVNYVAGDNIHYKLTAKNHSTNQGTGTNTPYGKAPLLEPVIIDKMPEYIEHQFDEYIDGEGNFDVASAVANGVLQVVIYDVEGNARTAELPSATVETIRGLDVAGDQTFNNAQKNDTFGYLSNAHPTNTTANPAEEIDFNVFTYTFENEKIDRNERLEIIYSVNAREEGLPYAKYTNGKSVWAPFFGWYSNNYPVANSTKNVAMDMASLLHDAGISGDRGHEMTPAEFLSSSYAWQPGGNDNRRHPGGSGSTLTDNWYDDSANKQKSHTGYMRETANNMLYNGFTSGDEEENFLFAAQARVNDGGVTADERIMWAQDGMQLNRAWLYAASEMVPDVKRGSHGTSSSNFYEDDQHLNSQNIHVHSYTPYREDAYSYAVQLHEVFTVRLHAANMGDRQVESGLQYTEILPLGISPYDEAGNIIGVKAYDGYGVEIPADRVSYNVIQTPEDDNGFRAPAQSQEAGTYKADSTRDDMIPYVVQVEVEGSLSSMFRNAGATITEQDKRQIVEIQARVYEELAPSADGKSYWHDEFTLTTIEEEEYVEIYSKEYGALTYGVDTLNRWRYVNDAMELGIDVNDLKYNYSWYDSYISTEPWGLYIRGLNAQNTTTEFEGKIAATTGDQLAMRKPTLRVWSDTTKDSYDEKYHDTIEQSTVDLYEEFTINSIVENQQFEVLPEYNRRNSGYNYYSGDNYNNDIWINAPQTIGGARGSWFEPTMTIALPYGIAPVVETNEGNIHGKFYIDLADLQDVVFEASVNTVTYNSSTFKTDVSDYFDVQVELIEDEKGERFVLHFTPNDPKAATVAYGESLVISPRVAAVDSPMFGDDQDSNRYQEVLTFANTERPVFNPIVSDRYTTGSTPSRTARDLGTASSAPNNTPSNNGLTISRNDLGRLDTSTQWNVVSGVSRITERLVAATQAYTEESEVLLNKNLDWIDTANNFVADSALGGKHDKNGAYGGTVLNTRHPSLVNDTNITVNELGVERDVEQVDPAGKFWYVTEVENSVTSQVNPYEEYKYTGTVHNSRFVITSYVTNFAQLTDEVRIKLGNDVYDREEFEAMGYSIDRVEVVEPVADEARQRVQWVVTTPQNDRGTRGELKHTESFKMMYQVQLVDGFEENFVTTNDVWNSDELRVDSFVSVITDDTDLIEGAQAIADFIVQNPRDFDYSIETSDEAREEDVDSNGSMEDIYASDHADIEIIKPKAEARINTTRPRIPYSNGLSGDTYFNSSDIIEYITTYTKITGGGLKELVVENIIPANESDDPNIRLSAIPIVTSALSTSSGIWEIPADEVALIEANGKNIEDLFKTFVYVSNDIAADGYELDGWTLLNPEGTSIYENEVFEFTGEDRANIKKIRTVVRAMDPENYLVPTGTRLDVDADPETEGKQEVVETDPENHATETFPDSVLDSSIKVSMRISSNTKTTLFIHDTIQVWGNYVADRFAKLDETDTRSYLTPSRPVVNVKYDTLYYRSDNTKPVEERFGWSDITTVAPKSSPHLKFKGEFINASQDMWARDEDNVYSQDTLIDPFVTFQLPPVMDSSGDWHYVANEDIDETHPLSDEHRTRYSLTNADRNMWTYKLVRADGTEASADSYLIHTDMHSGAWPNFDRNLVSVWFEGIVYPGDKIVVEFISTVDAYTPGADAEALKSRALITNNTGLLQPLNSRLNSDNKLGYALDNSDFNENGMTNDRLVFAERHMFDYESYDNFGKRKSVYSELAPAATTAPNATPLSEGKTATYEISVDNSKEINETPYPYPIMYDVLPHEGDTAISSATPRNSNFKPLLTTEGMKLEIEGRNKKVFNSSDYTVFVGPFTKVNGQIVETELLPSTTVMTEAFYNSLNTPNVASATRDSNFVRLSEIQNNPALMAKAKTMLVMFNNPTEVLPGQNKLKFSYNMKALLNAPVFLEQFDTESVKNDYAFWNSFVGTQRVDRFIPQESNNAGAYVTQQADKSYIGNYVWKDVNYDGEQNEGELIVDPNGRSLLKPAIDLDGDGTIDDPGINGVKVTLLTPAGYNVDKLNRPIHQVGNQWLVVDEVTGQSVLDEVFGQVIVSDGPLTTTTETDYYGNAGYYTFSNIIPSDYRVMFEFPAEYNKFSVTTTEVFKETGVEIFLPGETATVAAANNAAALSAVTAPASVNLDTTDAERMSFDLGVAQKVRVGGTIFKESLTTLDGYQNASERGIANYNVYLKDMDGDTVVDNQGNVMVTKTDANGKYEFNILPTERQYYIEVTDENDAFNYDIVVSPIIHNIDPFKASNDNDGYNQKGTTVVRSNIMNLPIDRLIANNYADMLSVSVGFYDKTTVGTIGNRVWDDLNRDGIQDENEPGIAGQRLSLEQYILVDGAWVKTSYTANATTNADGYYYFTAVPSMVVEGSGASRIERDTRYQVVVNSLVTGYTFALPYQGEDEELDSNFYRNGKMHEGEVGENLVSLIEYVNGIAYGVDNNTVDLGLVKHALSSLSGEAFIDTNNDGMKNDETQADSIYVATLEVKNNGAWVMAKHDENGNMIEPAKATLNDSVYRVSDANSYNFENLHIINNITLQPYEYRVVVSEIPLWQDVTELRVGDDASIDNDFTHIERTIYNRAASEAYIIGMEEDMLIPMHTFDDYAPVVNVDLGLVELNQTATMGDFIWYDINGNGLQDTDEIGAPGIRVVLNKLVDDELIYVAETVTDSEGYYEFTAPVSNFDKTEANYNQIIDYVVEFNMTSRQTLTEAFVGDDDSINSKFENLTQRGGVEIYEHSIVDPKHAAVSTPFTLASVDSNGYVDYATVSSTEDIDAGLIVHETIRVIGDTVYEDADSNGEQNAGEPGIEGLTVNLYRFDKETTTWVAHTDLEGNSSLVTDANGKYEFAVEVADLDKVSDFYRQAEQYRVMVEAPAHMRLVEINDEFAYFGDAPVEGIENIRPFSYVITEDIELIESDEEGVVLTTAVDHITADAGFNIYATETIIGGRYWDDANSNGIQDEDELSVEGEEITLWENIAGEWTVVEDLEGNSTQVTNADGEYRFVVAPTNYNETEDNFLQIREYKVTAERDGWQVWSELNVGEDTVIDSDIYTAEEFGNVHTGATHNFNIADNDGAVVDVTTIREDVEMDMGVTTYANEIVIGGRYWDDANANGIQDEDELSVADEEITLWRSIAGGQWTVVEDLNGASTMVTDANGEYRFVVAPTNYDHTADDYLAVYDYKVTAERAGWQVWAPKHAGEDTTVDSDITDDENFGTVHTGVTETFDVADNDTLTVDVRTVRDDVEMDMGVITYANEIIIGGMIWEDANNDGIVTEDEAPRANQVVKLWKFEANEWVEHTDLEGVATVTTSDNGEYRFVVAPTDYNHTSEDYLAPFRYLVTIEREGYELFSPVSATENDGIMNTVVDSFATQWEDNIHLGYSREYVTYDLASEGVIDVTTVRDDVVDFLGLTTYAQTVKLGGVAWHDENLDSIRDEDEELLEGREVTLWRLTGDEWIQIEDVNGVGTVETSENGFYEFEVQVVESYDRTSEDYLVPVEYRVVIEREGFEKWTTPFATEDVLTDSDTVLARDFAGMPETRNFGSMGEYDLFEFTHDGLLDITSLRDDLTKDAGIQIFEPTITIGGVVWEDNDVNGEFDNSEKTFGSVEVTLWENIDGQWVTVEDALGNKTQITAPDGSYEFEVFPTHYDSTHENYMGERLYRTTIEAPEGYALSEASKSATIIEMLIVSLNADLVEFDEEGGVDVELTKSDHTLSFPLVAIPMKDTVAILPGGWVLGILILSAGVFLVAVSPRKNRKLFS